jgi:twitching motility protein PilT
MTNTPDVDRLAGELNAWSDDAPGGSSRLEGWLRIITARGASDLLLVAGLPALIRVNGTITGLGEGPLDGADIETAVLGALPTVAARRYQQGDPADASLAVANLSRFRINLHRERGRAAATVRALPARPPALSDLGLPPNVERLASLPFGLVLIGGPTGSGKSTTLAALVDVINQRDAKHIVTIEDPIEYEHPHVKSVVEQVKVGLDVSDFPTALRSTLRQAPDVLVIGEMRDTETMQIALAAGETGHLVFSTLHTNDVASTVARIADSFPLERQGTIRQELSMALAAVYTQTLLPRIGGGRVAAAELLMVGYGARQHIRKNQVQHLHQEVTLTRRHGSFTFEESLARLVQLGQLERREALARTGHPEELDLLLRNTPVPPPAARRLHPRMRTRTTAADTACPAVRPAEVRA